MGHAPRSRLLWRQPMQTTLCTFNHRTTTGCSRQPVLVAMSTTPSVQSLETRAPAKRTTTASGLVLGMVVRAPSYSRLRLLLRPTSTKPLPYPSGDSKPCPTTHKLHTPKGAVGFLGWSS